VSSNSSLLTKRDSLAACARANNSASVADVVTVSCLFARQPISPPKSFMAKACELFRSDVLSANEALLAMYHGLRSLNVRISINMRYATKSWNLGARKARSI
jgi:hypothetical protein